MARTAVTITDLSGTAAVADPAGTNADATNGHSVDPGQTPLEEIVLRFTQTAATAHGATILAGVNPPALEAGEGDLTTGDIAQNDVVWVGPVSSGRFVQADGTLHIDLDTGFTGKVAAFRVPRT